MDKSHMFWGPGKAGAYNGGVPVPRVTYRCKSTVASATIKDHTHPCKKVTDHPGSCECVCGITFNEEVGA